MILEKVKYQSIFVFMLFVVFFYINNLKNCLFVHKTLLRYIYDSKIS